MNPSRNRFEPHGRHAPGFYRYPGAYSLIATACICWLLCCYLASWPDATIVSGEELKALGKAIVPFLFICPPGLIGFFCGVAELMILSRDAGYGIIHTGRKLRAIYTVLAAALCVVMACHQISKLQ